MLLVDRWEGLTATYDEVDGGRIVTEFLRLLREGPSAGLRVIVTGDRSALTGRLGSAIEERLILRLNDRGDYALANINPRNVPDRIPPGRAFHGDSGREVQIALLASAASGQAQADALTRIGDEARKRDTDLPRGFRPPPIAIIPTRITLQEVITRVDWVRPASPTWMLVGVGGDQVEAVGVDLAEEGPAAIIAGPARSGRSTALMVATHSLLDGQCRVVALTPRRSPLRTLSDHPRVVEIFQGTDVSGASLRDIVEAVAGPLAVCIDDAELLVEAPASPAVQTILREARDRGHVAVVAGTTVDLAGYRGFLPELKKAKTGLLLTPGSTSDGDVLGLRLSRGGLFPGPVGRGMLVVRGKTTLIQVPIPNSSGSA